MKKCQICGDIVDTGYIVHRDCLDALKKMADSPHCQKYVFQKLQAENERLCEIIESQTEEINFLRGRLMSKEV